MLIRYVTKRQPSNPLSSNPHPSFFLLSPLRLPLEHHRPSLVDRKAAQERQLQVLPSQVSEEETRFQDEKGQGEGTEDLRHQTHSDGQRHPGAGLHQPKEWRQPGRQVAAKVPVAAQPPAGL